MKPRGIERRTANESRPETETQTTLRIAYPIVLSSLPAPELASGFALDLSPDWRVFTFTLFIAAVTGAVAGAEETKLRQDLSDRLRALPDVTSVSEAFNQPLSGSMGNRLVMVQGDEPAHPREARFNFVSAEYFQTLSIQILKGRPFSSDEVRSRAPVVVISETAANKFWPGVDPIGQQIAMEDESAAGSKKFMVVGVARDTRSRHLWQKDGAFIYVPVPATKSRYLLVQTRSDPSGTMSVVRSLAASIDPALRTSVRQLNDSLNAQTVPFRALAWVSGVLGVLALVLASLGLYGVTSFIVARRTHEIGIRMALGARRADVVTLFLREGLKLTAFGVLLGLAGGVALSRLLESVLVDLSALDPFVFALVSLFLSLVATLAILAATRRATKVDPIVALRYE